MDVTVIWAAIIALGVFTYVVLDGFHLGIGIVFPFFPDEHERDLMTNTVAPVRTGDASWLVPGGAALLAVFPVVYLTSLSALYLPLASMLACLMLRGVSIRFRAKAGDSKPLWDCAFIAGSAGAALFQGIALGTFLQGISVDGSARAGIAARKAAEAEAESLRSDGMEPSLDGAARVAPQVQVQPTLGGNTPYTAARAEPQMERRINLAPASDYAETGDDDAPFATDDADEADFEPEPPRWEMQTPLRGPMATRQPAPAPQPVRPAALS